MTVDDFLARMVSVYGSPNTPDERAFYAEWRRSLKGASAEVLAKAAERIVDELTFWPRPAEAREAIRKAAIEIQGRRSAYVPPEHRPFEDPAPEFDDDANRAEMARTRGEETKARVAAMAAEFIASQKDKEIRAKPFVDWVSGQRPAFEFMQATSPNVGLHSARPGVKR